MRGLVELKENGFWSDEAKEDICQHQHRVAFYEGHEDTPCGGCPYENECHAA